MSRFVGDQNTVGFLFESGAYANTTGTTLQWPGMVQSHEADENTNVIEVRYANTGNRNVGQFVDGPLDYDGTLSFYPQDWKMLAFALGSNVDAGSPSPYTHTISEVNSASGNAFTSGTLNPFVSFSIYDAKKGPATGENFVRTIQGCVIDSLNISAKEGEPINMEIAYMAQSGTFSSGAITAITDPGTRPYLWQDVQLHLPSGTVIAELKDFDWGLKQNLERRHYLNGSRVASVPIPTNRDYEMSATIDATSERTKILYNQYFLGGSTFNAMLAISASAGSREIFIVMSGCKMVDMSSPSEADSASPQEQKLTIKPQTCSATINDDIQLYNPW